MPIRTSDGQSAVEYAVLAAVIVAALLAMQIYLKRGIVGKLRVAADTAGEQYDPRNTAGSFTLTSARDATTTIQTLNEPQLSALLGRCIDLNGDGDCTDDRVFGTITQVALTGRGEQTARAGEETVGALGTALFNEPAPPQAPPEGATGNDRGRR